MAKRRISKEEYERVLEALDGVENGASLSEIWSVLGKGYPLRSLQRRLHELVETGRIVQAGAKRGTRYFLPPGKMPQATGGASLKKTAAPEGYSLPGLSAEGEAIRREVRQPIPARHPVGYRREFLESYRPNTTAYLTPGIRRHLAELGRSSDEKSPAGTYARHILNRLLIDLTWNSSRLEGNTYSLLETERLLDQGESAEGKEREEAQMILNHKAAIELLVEDAAHIGFNRYTICNLHAILADNLLKDPQAGGRVREIPVQIGGTVFHPLEGPQAIAECFDQLLATAEAIVDPFEQAFFAMVQIPYLQPFEDVNKRVSRLAANIPLIRRNLCPLSFIDVPTQDYIDGVLGVYERNRIELLRDIFVWAYERSSARYAAVRQSLGEPDSFRLKHRDLLRRMVGEIIREGMDRSSAIRYIQREIESHLPEPERARMVEIVEEEVMGLHEGNFARYRVRPSEFQEWRARWK
ncbi:cell filamentation protein Fic [Spartobacteria bacterium LR76]|nr:cell filamentation protein Fic [Spartobacteria bacterium LR76]